MYPFHLFNSAGIFNTHIVHGLELEMLISVILMAKMLDDAYIFESHLAVGDWVFIETPARKMALGHTYM